MGVSQTLTITQMNRDFDGNFSNVRIMWTSTQYSGSWNGYSRTAYYYVSVNGGTETKYSVKYTLPAATTNTIVNTTIKVPHNDDGTATVKVRTWMDTDISAGVIEKSQTSTLVAIPRATSPTISASSVDIGSNVTISLNRASSSFAHTLTYSFGSLSGTIGSGIGTSKVWTIPSSFANQIPSATSGTCIITCNTYNGSTFIGAKSVNLTLNVPSSVVPVIKSISLAEGTEDLKEHFTVFVQNNSTLAVSVNAVGSAGSSITKVETEIQGTVYNGTSFVSALLTVSGDITVKTTITDSRGRTATQASTVAVVEYDFPTIHSMSVKRIDTAGNASEDGERISVFIHYSTYNITNQNGEYENTRTYKLQYRRSDESSFTTFESGQASLIFSQSKDYKNAPIISNDYSYVIRLEVSDFFKTVICDVELPTAYTLMDFNSSGKGIAFGKVSEMDAFEVALPLSIQGGIMPIALENETNLFEITTPGYYTGGSLADMKDIRTYTSNGSTIEEEITKSPVQMGFSNNCFLIEVLPLLRSGTAVSHVLQKLTVFSSKGAVRFFRAVYGGTYKGNKSDWYIAEEFAYAYPDLIPSSFVPRAITAVSGVISDGHFSPTNTKITDTEGEMIPFTAEQGYILSDTNSGSADTPKYEIETERYIKSPSFSFGNENNIPGAIICNYSGFVQISGQIRAASMGVANGSCMLAAVYLGENLKRISAYSSGLVQSGLVSITIPEFVTKVSKGDYILVGFKSTVTLNDTTKYITTLGGDCILTVKYL